MLTITIVALLRMESFPKLDLRDDGPLDGAQRCVCHTSATPCAELIAAMALLFPPSEHMVRRKKRFVSDSATDFAEANQALLPRNQEINS